jgi:hypothetical protein
MYRKKLSGSARSVSTCRCSSRIGYDEHCRRLLTSISRGGLMMGVHCPRQVSVRCRVPAAVVDVESHAGGSITGDLMAKAW